MRRGAYSKTIRLPGCSFSGNTFRFRSYGAREETVRKPSIWGTANRASPSFYVSRKKRTTTIDGVAFGLAVVAEQVTLVLPVPRYTSAMK
jgi:hypothetical protein